MGSRDQGALEKGLCAVRRRRHWRRRPFVFRADELLGGHSGERGAYSREVGHSVFRPQCVPATVCYRLETNDRRTNRLER